MLRKQGDILIYFNSVRLHVNKYIYIYNIISFYIDKCMTNPCLNVSSHLFLIQKMIARNFPLFVSQKLGTTTSKNNQSMNAKSQIAYKYAYISFIRYGIKIKRLIYQIIAKIKYYVKFKMKWLCNFSHLPSFRMSLFDLLHLHICLERVHDHRTLYWQDLPN